MTDDELRALLSAAKVIAVVGFSPNPDRPSNQVGWYLHHQGYRLYGVNPTHAGGAVFDVPVVATLADVPERIDVVEVFRRADACPDVARAAAALDRQPGAIWLQLGIRSPEARAIAGRAGIPYVEDRCMKIEHSRLLR